MGEATLIAVKTAGLAFLLMAAISMLCAGLINAVVAVLARSQRKKAPPRHRIIHLGVAQSGQDATRESRTRHHASRTPNR